MLVRSDGMPTYNFACVVDDSAMVITHVIRGEEHLPNICGNSFSTEGSDFTLAVRAPAAGARPRPRQLSKRHGATSVGEMRKIGYPPAALVNYLSLLGWSPGDDTEIMAREELVRRFSLERVSGSASIFDTNKLEWMSSHHMKQLSAEELLMAWGRFSGKRAWSPATGNSWQERFRLSRSAPGNIPTWPPNWPSSWKTRRPG